MADTTRNDQAGLIRPEFGENELQELARLTGGDDVAARLAARERFLAAEAPDRVTHLWRFSDPARLMPATLTAAAAKAVPAIGAPEGAALTIDLEAGRPVSHELGAGVDAGQITVTPGAAGDAGDTATASVFGDLNRSAWNTGCTVTVAPGAVLAGPVRIRVRAGAGATLPRLTVVVGDRAEATIIEEHAGGGAETRVVGHTAVLAGSGARVRHVQLQMWDDGTSGHMTVNGHAAADADLMTVFGSFGGERCKSELVTDLAGAGAHSEMIGVALATGGQHFDVHTRHRHLAGHTTSNIDFKAVAADTARSTYTGLIRIEEEARHCEAFQENRNLLLSDKARADAIPELEIHNQEVSCSHGATVAPVDPEQLFYLESRGLEPGESLGLVVRGFLENTMAKLPEDLRASVESFVAPRLASIREARS